MLSLRVLHLKPQQWRTGNASACDLHRQNLALIVSRQGGHQALVDGSLAKALLMQSVSYLIFAELYATY